MCEPKKNFRERINDIVTRFSNIFFGLVKRYRPSAVSKRLVWKYHYKFMPALNTAVVSVVDRIRKNPKAAKYHPLLLIKKLFIFLKEVIFPFIYRWFVEALFVYITVYTVKADIKYYHHYVRRLQLEEMEKNLIRTIEHINPVLSGHGYTFEVPISEYLNAPNVDAAVITVSALVYLFMFFWVYMYIRYGFWLWGRSRRAWKAAALAAAEAPSKATPDAIAGTEIGAIIPAIDTKTQENAAYETTSPLIAPVTDNSDSKLETPEPTPSEAHRAYVEALVAEYETNNKIMRERQEAIFKEQDAQRKAAAKEQQAQRKAAAKEQQALSKASTKKKKASQKSEVAPTSTVSIKQKPMDRWEELTWRQRNIPLGYIDPEILKIGTIKPTIHEGLSLKHREEADLIRAQLAGQHNPATDPTFVIDHKAKYRNASPIEKAFYYFYSLNPSIVIGSDW
jgi:hypothetical protein